VPRKKNLKRRVRERMGKTGESYTAALAQVRERTASSVRPWQASKTAEEKELERLLDELWRSLGCSVTRDPSVARESASPGFRIQPASGEPFYLDVTAALMNAPGKLPLTFRYLERLLSPRQLEILRARSPKLPVAAAVVPAAHRLVDPDLPYVVAVAAPITQADAGVIEVWTGAGGPHLQVSAILVVEANPEALPVARLYHHPEPRRPLVATPLLRLPQAVWTRGRYVHGEGEPLASLLGPRWVTRTRRG
jgi:hypothetical protein